MNGVIIGKIVKTSGIHGYLKVQPFTNRNSRFTELNSLFLDENCLIEKKISNVVVNESIIKIKFDGIDTPEKAEEFVNFYLYIPKDKVIPLSGNEIYYFELAECKVEYEKGSFADIKEILESQSLLYILIEVNKKEYMIPFNKHFIGDIDKQNKKIEILNFNMIEGNEI